MRLVRIAPIVLDDASLYERKSQRIDGAALAGAGHTLSLTPDDADVVHVYGGRELPRMLRIRKPYVANAPMLRIRIPGIVRLPRMIVTPHNLPEAVEEAYFGAVAEKVPNSVGFCLRRSAIATVEQTIARVQRFRDDVEFRFLRGAPSPQEIASMCVWWDPASEEEDYDGYTAEALACGVPVVASWTPLNAARLEKGRTGWLVPARDPNEMTHAILAALFKPEAARARSEAARQTIGKFRSSQRLRVLTRIYETIVS